MLPIPTPFGQGHLLPGGFFEKHSLPGTHQSAPIYKISTTPSVISGSQFLSLKSDMWQAHMETNKGSVWNLSCLRKLPCIDAVAIEWLSPRDQEFCLEGAWETWFSPHFDALLGKEHSVESKEYPNSSKKEPKVKREQQKKRGNGD